MKVIKRYIDLYSKVEKLKDELSSTEWMLQNAIEEMNAGVTRSGGGGDGESWTQWWVFPATMTDNEVEKAMADLGVGGHYNGAGQSFAHDYSYYRKGSRVLVEQNGGLDV